MTEDKGIFIKNVYYMLAYVFQALRQSGYEKISAEEFENIHDLLAAILCRGISSQLKQGLYRTYETVSSNESALRGKLEMNETMRLRLRRKRLLGCEYDEFTEDNLLNRILKTAAFILITHPNVSKTLKNDLKTVLRPMAAISLMEPPAIRWERLRYHRTNKNYEMLANICRFIFDGLILSTEQGRWKMADFIDDEHMSALFEKFLLHYYRRHHPELHPSSPQIRWDLDSDSGSEYLPVMQSDLVLRRGEETLIIDAKYYGSVMQMRYGSAKQHSSNLYQIYSYVKNYDCIRSGRVSGLLLYARTSEHICPDCGYKISGSRISVKTLDLNRPFPEIKASLDEIAGTVLSAS